MAAEVVFWAEAHAGIGMGHLMECLALAGETRRRGRSVHVVVTPYEAAGMLLERHGLSFSLVPLEMGTQAIARLAESGGAQMVVVNHRAVSADHLAALRQAGRRVAVIDQLGGRAVIADLLFNGSPVEGWRTYSFPEAMPCCRFGPAYAIMRPEFAALRAAAHPEPRGADNAGVILVSMGGIDRTGATLRVAEALLPLGPAVRKEIIVGAGFAHGEALSRMLLDESFSVARAVTDLGARMTRSDIAISAGGNTLFELACIGTPTLVLWEDPHEEVHGRAFADVGSALVLGNGLSTPVKTITAALQALLADAPARTAMRQSGRDFVDGLGVVRVCDEFLALVG